MGGTEGGGGPRVFSTSIYCTTISFCCAAGTFHAEVNGGGNGATEDDGDVEAEEVAAVTVAAGVGKMPREDERPL